MTALASWTGLGATQPEVFPGILWIVIALGALPALVVYAIYRLALHVGKDMDARGENGTVYALLVFFALPVGLPLWWFRRRR